MDSYEVIITPHALSQLNDYVSYIQYTMPSIEKQAS